MISSDDLKLANVPAGDEDPDRILDFVRTLNGYEIAGSFERCAEIAESPSFDSIDELRICLFFHYRCLRHSGDDETEADVRMVRSVLARIRELVAERGRA